MIESINVSKTEWDFSSVLGENLDDKIEKDMRIISEMVKGFISKWRERKDYLENPLVLKEALDDYEELMCNYGTSGNIGHCLRLMMKKDQSNDETKKRYNKIKNFSLGLENEIIFFILNLSKIPENKQKTFLDSEELSEYRHYLEVIFREGRYTLSESEEEIINLKSGPACESWIRIVSEFLSREEREVFINGEKKIKTFSEVLSGIDNPDKRSRDSCAEAFNDILNKHADLAVAEINATLQNKRIDDGLRGFSRPDESRIVSDDVDIEFIDSLVRSVSKRFDLSRKYYELKAKLLGLEKLEYHERNLVYGNESKKLPYSESARIVYNCFKNFDSDFGEISKRLIEGGNIDVYPAKGKRSGAFCSWNLKIGQVYIFLNYDDKMKDLRTLAHELGHAINGELMKIQNSLNFTVPMSVTEVASKFTENLVFNNFIESVKSDEEKLFLLMSKLNDEISSVMRQVGIYNFEKELHNDFRKKDYLSKTEIGGLFSKNMGAYIGDYVDFSEGSENWWIYVSHIRDPFYVFSYASGLLIARAMIKSFKEDPKFKDKIKEFFSTGGLRSPRELFKKMDFELDDEFWNRGLDEIEALLNETWELAKKLKKI